MCGLSLCCPVVGNICGAVVRGKVRSQKGISGSLLTDLLAWFCCPLCALVQEAQEMKAIGSASMVYGGLAMERA